MLKTRFPNETWLVQQPDHARVSGFLAAHWGNDTFSPLGHYAAYEHHERLREIVIHAIAEHDNGWWEWEAYPEMDPEDGLPVNLSDVTRTDPSAGFQRWRLGIPRLSGEHPYAALLVSMHAFYLYAPVLENIGELDESLRHPIFRSDKTNSRLASDCELTRTFIQEQSELQAELHARISADAELSHALQPDHLLPHVRMLQILDALSLLLSFGNRKTTEVMNVPRTGWDDQITMQWSPIDQFSTVCDPYPFDTDPLEVWLPVRIVPQDRTSNPHPLVTLHETPLQTIRFLLKSQA